MTEIDWKASLEAEHASLPERLERLALRAETSKTYVQESRMMRAEGVADILYEALDEIKKHRGINQ
jgi:hypothetical protein